jgi:hypothetical protein
MEDLYLKLYDLLGHCDGLEVELNEHNRVVISEITDASCTCRHVWTISNVIKMGIGVVVNITLDIWWVKEALNG